MKRTLKIGTRGSRLALWQAEFIKGLIKAAFPEIEIKIIVIRTTGDKILDSPLSEMGGKGVFVKEIEDALIQNKIDAAVHSMKDLPTFLPEGLAIGAVAKRHDPRDALISNEGMRFYNLPKGARVGTSSLRRQAQLLAMRPDLQIIPLRGNVDTRLRKLRTEGLDAVVLALAGLERMGFDNQVTEIFSVDVLVPAPGQGAVAVECRENDEDVIGILSKINHEDSWAAANLERAFLERLGGGCQIPAGCYAEVRDVIKIIGLIASPDGRQVVRDSVESSLDDSESPGRELALRMLEKGADAILLKLVQN